MSTRSVPSVGAPVAGPDVTKSVIKLDALANLLGAAVLWAAAPAWTDAFGLGSSLPILALGAIFLANGMECWVTARRAVMPAAWLWALAAADFAFATFAVAIAATDPTGAESWARWVLGIAGFGAFIVGDVKANRALRTTRPS